MRIFFLLIICLAALSCAESRSRPLEFVDVSDGAGVLPGASSFAGLSEASLELKDIIGGGVGVLDYDQDGDLDLFLIQGTLITSGAAGNEVDDDSAVTAMWLFRNDSSGGAIRFAARVGGLEEIRGGAGMGVAVGDINGDGFPDIYATTSGQNHLLINDSDGHFNSVPLDGLAQNISWSIGATITDVNRDGQLDVYTGNFAKNSDATNGSCYSVTGAVEYCSAQDFDSAADQLLINASTSDEIKFTDESEAYGLKRRATPSLSVAAGYLNGDDWPDLLITNDGAEDTLLINDGGAEFVKRSRRSGVSHTSFGDVPDSHASIIADHDKDGDFDVIIAAASPHGVLIFDNIDNQRLRDISIARRIAWQSGRFDGFGIAVEDFDGDGLEDIAVAHGAVRRIQHQIDAGDRLPLRQPDLIYNATQNDDNNIEFESAALANGNALASRGMVSADLDNDGDADLVILGVNRVTQVLQNRSNPESWFGLVPRLASSGRIAVGARVSVPFIDGAGIRLVHRDGSFASSSDPRLRYYPLRELPDAIEVNVVWPDATREQFLLEQPTGYITLVQGEGAP